jgi:hypothetical protein
MRDVTPNSSDLNIKVIVEYLIEFIKNPIQKIKNLPHWNWKTLILVQLVLGIVSGFLAGLIKFNIFRILFGILIMPFVSTTAALLLTLFLYYYFQFFENKTEDFRKIFTLVILSSLPFYIFQILSEYFAPVTLIGFSFTSLLGVVGLCENFQVKKNRAYQIVGLLFGLIFVAWIFNRQTS